MKRILIISVLLSMHSTGNALFAQTERHTWLIGGNAHISNDFSVDYFRVNINPDVGYFIVDNLSIGLEVPLWFARADDAAFTSITSSSIGTLPSIRYYLGLTNSVNVLLNAYGGISFGKTKYGNGLETSKRNYGTLGGRAGLAFFLNKTIALETTLNYQNVRRESSISSGDNQLSFTVGFQIHFRRGDAEKLTE